MIKDTIAKNRLTINGTNFTLAFLITIGIITATPNQPAAKLINKSDNPKKKVFNGIIFLIISKEQLVAPIR